MCTGPCTIPFRPCTCTACIQVDEPPGLVPADAEPPAGPAPSVFKEVWTEAESGNARAVIRLLRRHNIHPNTPHPEHGSQLVLHIATISTFSERRDSCLADVLRALHHAGWSLAPQMTESGDNALHLLARHKRGYQVYHRLKAITAMEVAFPKEDNMLTVVNAAGWTPEGMAAVHCGELVAFLHVQQLRIQVAAQRARGNRGGLFAGIRGAWLNLRGAIAAEALL